MDPFQETAKLTIAKSNSPICAVTASRELYFQTSTHPAAQPLFQFSDGQYLTRCSFTHDLLALLIINLWIWQYAILYVSRNFCIRAATTAETVGLPDCLIKVLRQWKSNVYHAYIKTPTRKDTAILKTPTRKDTAILSISGLTGSWYFVHIYGRRNGEAGAKITPSKIITEEGGGLETRQGKNKI